MKNELFIENRRTHKSQPTTVKSADCEIRHYPKGVGSSAESNSITVEVIDRKGIVRENELIHIQFADGFAFSGSFADLKKHLEASVIVCVNGGVVQEAYSNNRHVDVSVLDYDNMNELKGKKDEGIELDELEADELTDYETMEALIKSKAYTDVL